MPGAPQTSNMSGQLGRYRGMSLLCGVSPCLGAPRSKSIQTLNVVTLAPLLGTSAQEADMLSETSPPKTRPAGLPCPPRVTTQGSAG